MQSLYEKKYMQEQKKIEEEIVTKTNKSIFQNLFSFTFSSKKKSVAESKKMTVERDMKEKIIVKQQKELLIENIAAKIKTNMCILCHGFNPELVDALRKSAQEGKKVNVLMTEQPLSELGCFYAKNLMKEKMFIDFYPAAAARQAVKQTDCVFLKGEMITPTKIVTEMGGELLAELAFQKNIPVYITTLSNSVDQKGNLKETHFIKKQKIAGSHYFFRHQFEQINPLLISAIISEKGVHAHDVFIELATKKK